MMAKPMKTLELHYPMIQFLIKHENTPLLPHPDNFSTKNP